MLAIQLTGDHIVALKNDLINTPTSWLDPSHLQLVFILIEYTKEYTEEYSHTLLRCFSALNVSLE